VATAVSHLDESGRIRRPNPGSRAVRACLSGRPRHWPAHRGAAVETTCVLDDLRHVRASFAFRTGMPAFMVSLDKCAVAFRQARSEMYVS
jgi:hypothetical protein